MRYLPTTAGDTRRGFDEGRRPALDKLPKVLADKITERDRIKAQRGAALARVADLGTEQRAEAARQADDDAAAKAARAGKPIPAPVALSKLEDDRAKAARAAQAQEAAFVAVHSECEELAARHYWDSLEQVAAERATIRAEITAKAEALAAEVEAAVDRYAVTDWLHRGIYDRSVRTWPSEVMDLARYGLDRITTTPVGVRDVIIAAATTCLDDPTD